MIKLCLQKVARPKQRDLDEFPETIDLMATKYMLIGIIIAYVQFWLSSVQLKIYKYFLWYKRRKLSWKTYFYSQQKARPSQAGESAFLELSTVSNNTFIPGIYESQPQLTI